VLLQVLTAALGSKRTWGRLTMPVVEGDFIFTNSFFARLQTQPFFSETEIVR
jgi:hypothetical protein